MKEYPAILSEKYYFLSYRQFTYVYTVINNTHISVYNNPK